LKNKLIKVNLLRYSLFKKTFFYDVFISFILLHEIYYMRYTCLTIITKIKSLIILKKLNILLHIKILNLKNH